MTHGDRAMSPSATALVKTDAVWRNTTSTVAGASVSESRRIQP